MPAMSWYELKVTGLLGGPKSDHEAAVTQFLNLVPAAAPPAPTDPWGPDDLPDTITKVPWPHGFMLPNYYPAVWHVSVEESAVREESPMHLIYPPSLTQFTFHAQVGVFQPGNLFTNKTLSLKEVAWFYNYCDCEWFKNLRAGLRAINDGLAATKTYVINPLDLRDWKWYCGNGGGE